MKSIKLTEIDELPFVTVTVAHQKDQLEIPHVLVDTGSGTTVLSVDWVRKIKMT